MRIISKFKDYYDYLQGIWGIDSKLVLDRTEFYKIPYVPSDQTIIRFAICGYKVEGIYIDGKFLYGGDIEKYDVNLKYSYLGDYKLYYFINDNTGYRYKKILKNPTKFSKGYDPNESLDCPILVENVYGEYEYKKVKYSKFPILKDYDFIKVYSSEELWLMLSEWLGREKPIINTQTDKEKIITKGFDLKSSFRNIKK